MRLATLTALLLTGMAVLVLGLAAQPEDKKERNLEKKGPPPFEPGRLLPPHVRDQLELTADQERQLADLEQEVKTRLLKIFTPEQRRQLEQFRSKGFDKKGKKDGKKKPPDKDKDRDRDAPRDKDR